MTAYLDEYIPNSKNAARQVQSDVRKLKFNNIQSCLALVLLPVGGNSMIGVHLTTGTTGKQSELDQVIGELLAAAGGATCDAYLVANYTDWVARTNLAKDLKKVVRKVYYCDVPRVSDKNRGADADVKFELTGGLMTAYVRRHAVELRDARGQSIRKPNAVFGPGAIPGKQKFVTDRDDKPWMPVPFQPLQ